MSVPAPLNMTDAEILDWMNDACDRAEMLNGNWWIYAWEFPSQKGLTIREAICLAAAYHKEVNE